MTYNYHGFTIISMSLSGFAIYKGSNPVGFVDTYEEAIELIVSLR